MPNERRRRVSLACRVFVAACAGRLLTGNWAAAAERTVDLELVLAANISGSMDFAEAALQRRGFARAIRHPSVASPWAGGAGSLERTRLHRFPC